MKKLLTAYSYLISEISDRVNGLSFEPSWGVIPTNILTLAMENIHVKTLNYKTIDDTNRACVETVDGLSFFGPTAREELLCGSFSLRRAKKIANKVLELDEPISNEHAGLLHNLALRYMLEFSAYPYWASRTASLRLGDTFVDIGAFRGYVSVKAALKVGHQGKVIAIEPIKNNLIYIEAQKEANDLPQIEIVESVFSANEKSEVEFYRSKNQENSEVKDHIDTDAQTLTLPNTRIEDLVNKIKVANSKRVVISLTTNGTEPELLIPLLKSLQNISVPHVEIVIPIIYIESEIRQVIAESGMSDLIVSSRYPWLTVTMIKS